ncbi:MAG TPA: outer membrane lipoprotein LolB [Desulfuromonadales bacterium]|nr:outer membrane lipoprotein LolB [Desulfuromonadales bacterium]
MKWLSLITIIIPVLLLPACSTSLPRLEFTPGASVETLSAAVSVSITSAEHGMSGSGFLVYRRPDRLHLIILSPFGTTLLEAFALGEQITLLYPSRSTAYVGRIDELPLTSGMHGWRFMRWVMDAEPAASNSISGTVERSGIQDMRESVTYENGLVARKKSQFGDQAFYSRYALLNGVPFASEVVLLTAGEQRIRLVLDEPEVNTPLEQAVFTPQLEGITILPLSDLRGL